MSQIGKKNSRRAVAYRRSRVFFEVRLRMFAGCLLLLIPVAVLADEPAVGVAGARNVLSPQETAALVDQIFARTWAAAGVQPAEPASDVEFVRRLYLDLAGRIPSVSEVRAFHADAAESRRKNLVEHLLDRPAFVRHFTILWRNALIPQARTAPQLRGLMPGFEAWLWTRFSDGIPYDRMVRELITAAPDIGPESGLVLRRASSPGAFYLARQLQPESLATGMSRAFLGVRLDCAQCHDHPFDSWKQDQFWGLAAFFAELQPGQDEPSRMAMLSGRSGLREIEIGSTGRTILATFPDQDRPAEAGSMLPREQLAEWLTHPENPWFSRMAANRIWEIFMGRGIVHPVDDFSDLNPPAHPEVLDLLAQQLVAHDFDLRFLIRAITSTRTYQLSSRQSHDSQDDAQMFARSTLRGLTPEQLFDSLAEATGFYQPYRSENPFVVDTESTRGRFLTLFEDEASTAQQKETTILQALAMMNGEFVADATSPDVGQTLTGTLRFPIIDDRERIEMLFLAALSRSPDAEELAEVESLLEAASAPGDRDAILADLFWALLNSSEFLLNH